MDANEVLGVMQWAVSSVALVGLAALWWLDARHREAERRLNRLEGVTHSLMPLAEAAEQAAIDDLVRQMEGPEVPA